MFIFIHRVHVCHITHKFVITPHNNNRCQFLEYTRKRNLYYHVKIKKSILHEKPYFEVLFKMSPKPYCRNAYIKNIEALAKSSYPNSSSQHRRYLTSKTHPTQESQIPYQTSTNVEEFQILYVIVVSSYENQSLCCWVNVVRTSDYQNYANKHSETLSYNF